MPGKLSRKALSQAVRNALGEDGIWEMKQTYGSAAGRKWQNGTFAACMAKAAREGGKPFSVLAYECAQATQIGEEFAKAWE